MPITTRAIPTARWLTTLPPLNSHQISCWLTQPRASLQNRETDKAIADFEQALDLSGGDGLGDLAAEQLSELKAKPLASCRIAG